MTIVLVKKKKHPPNWFLELKNHPIDENWTFVESAKLDNDIISVVIKHNKSGLQTTSNIKNIRLPNSTGTISIKNQPYAYDYDYGTYTTDIIKILQKAIKRSVVVATMYRIGYTSMGSGRKKTIDAFGDIFGDDTQ